MFISKLLLKDVISRKINEIGRYAVKNEVVMKLAGIIYRSSFFKMIKNRLDKMMDRKLLDEVKRCKLPKHIAIIMDGNRRFADKLGLEHIEGHLLGRNRFEEVIDWCFSEIGINVLTFYAFSMENFRRDGKEVNDIMRLCIEELEQGANSFRIHDNKIRVRIIGHLESLPKDVHDAAKRIMDRTKNYDKRFLNVALAYGGREDILQAIHRIAGDVKDNSLKLEDIKEEIVSSYLYTNGLPDPNLILRTSGEERLSNFLLWQAAHSDLYFSDVYWPELRKRDLLRAIRMYQQRECSFSN